MDSLMDFNEALQYLRLSRATVLRLIYRKQIPATKIGRQWRFNRERLDKWVRDHENIKQK
jgi:excisionase family DNA binding protein